MAAAPGAQAPQGPVLTIEKIYVKDASIEIPNAPQIFMEAIQPQIDLQMNSATQQVSPGLYELVLTITVTAKAGERTVFLVEAAQAGIFQISGYPEPAMQEIMGVHCPTVIFPYARETIANLINRAGFPPINLAPISFQALYEQQRAQQAQASPIIQVAH